MTSDSGILCPADPENDRRRRFKIKRGKNQAAYDQDAEVVDELEPKPEEREKPTELALPFSRSSSSENDTFLEEKGSLAEMVRSFGPLSYGVVSVIGRRREMEDAVRVELGFMNLQSEPLDFFAVYDGHGGPQVAEGCWERLHKVLEEVMKEGEGKVGGGFKNGGVVDWEKVMVGCFGKMDGEFIGEDMAEEVNMVGSTAVVAVVGKEVVVVANCGDSRAVLSKGGVALALSVDHKPDRPDELSRVEAAGGKVISWDGLRVMGVLATSRSIGDKYLKPYVISEPEVVVSSRTDADEFLILASDGLWDVISNDFACKVVRKCLEGRMRRKSQDGVHLENFASEAAAVLTELAMARGSRDNISVIVVELNKSRKLPL